MTGVENEIILAFWGNRVFGLILICPYVAANAIGLVLGLLNLIQLPISLIIWDVTLVMTGGKMNDQTVAVNAAIRAGVPIQDV